MTRRDTAHAQLQQYERRHSAPVRQPLHIRVRSGLNKHLEDHLDAASFVNDLLREAYDRQQLWKKHHASLRPLQVIGSDRHHLIVGVGNCRVALKLTDCKASSSEVAEKMRSAIRRSHQAQPCSVAPLRRWRFGLNQIGTMDSAGSLTQGVVIIVSLMVALISVVAYGATQSSIFLFGLLAPLISLPINGLYIGAYLCPSGMSRLLSRRLVDHEYLVIPTEEEAAEWGLPPRPSL